MTATSFRASLPHLPSRIASGAFAMIAAALLAAALWLRWDLLVTRPLWLDEIFTGALVSGADLRAIFTQWLASDVHPPLHYLFMKGWSTLFGTSNIALRLPSLIFSALGIAIGARAMAARCGRDAGWIAAIALAVPSAAIFYAAEARAYAMMMLLAILCIVAHLRLRESWRRGDALLFAIAATLVSLSHYFGMLYAGLLWIALLWEAVRGDARRVLALVPGAALFAMALVPWLWWHLPYMLSKGGGNFWIADRGFLADLAGALVSCASDPPAFLLWIAIPLFLALRSGTIGARQERDFPARLYLGIVAAAALLVAIISIRSPIIVPRYLTVFIPMTMLTGAALIARQPDGIRQLYAAAAGAATLAAAQAHIGQQRTEHLAWERASAWAVAAKPEAIVFVFDDPAGRHIGLQNLAAVGGFPARRLGSRAPVEARTVIDGRPLGDALPAGRAIAVIKVTAHLANYRSDPAYMDRLRTRYPVHRCAEEPDYAPQACVFDTQAGRISPPPSRRGR